MPNHPPKNARSSRNANKVMVIIEMILFAYIVHAVMVELFAHFNKIAIVIP